MTRPTPVFFLPMVYTIYLFCVASIILLSACHEKNVEAFLPVVPTKISISGVGVGVGVRHSNDNDNSQGGVVRADLSALLPTLGSISSHGLSTSSNSGTRLYAVPQKRIARRDLKKRPNRRGRRSGSSINPTTSSSSSTQTVPSSSSTTTTNTNTKIIESEVRPLVRAAKVEAGEDYWIDEEELQKSLDRKMAIQNRKANEGEITQEKLRTEVVAPYKQNWIGLFSVGVVVLATIVTNFPELLQSPVIPIPDL